MLNGHKRLAAGGGVEPRFVQGALSQAPRIELRQHRGEWFLVHFYAHADGEFVRAITRLEIDGDRVARLQNYFFNPDFIGEVCGELGLPFRSNGHRWWLPARKEA